MLCEFDLNDLLSYCNSFLKNDLMINSQATRNLFGHPDLGSWVPGGATGKKFLNHRLCLGVGQCEHPKRVNKTYNIVPFTSWN